jgi:hypothetical protein
VMNDCETLSIPKLNKRAIIKQILARWLRLAFPAYFIVLFIMFVYLYLGSGPAFSNVVLYNMIDPLKKYWWSIFLFIQNVYPWEL